MSGKQSSLNLSFFFLFLFYRKVLKFIKFRVFFKVLFRRIFGWIFFQLNFLGRTSIVAFHLFLFLGKLHSRSEWRNQVRFPEFVLRVRLVVLDKKEEVTFFGSALSGITSPFSTPAKVSAARGLLDWFGFFVKWYINLCRLSNAKAILLEEQ